jgi:hypothetical protein
VLLVAGPAGLAFLLSRMLCNVRGLVLLGGLLVVLGLDRGRSLAGVQRWLVSIWRAVRGSGSLGKLRRWLVWICER